MANMYSTPNYQTNQGQQYDQTSSFMASMGNGQPLPPQQLQQATAGANQASGEVANAQTAQGRQNYINNDPDIANIQSNFEQQARGLYDIDRQIAASGQYNPTPAPDATSFGSVGASPLELTSSILGSSSFNPVNPEIGMKTQQAQQGSIIDILNMLNDVGSREFNSRKGSYASNLKGLQAIAEQWSHLLDKNADLGMNKYNQQQENYRAGLSAGNSAKNLKLNLQSEVTDFFNRVKGGDQKVSPEDYLKAKQSWIDQGGDSKEFDTNFRTYRNAQNPYYQVDPQAMTASEQKAAQNYNDTQVAGKDLLDSLDSIASDYHDVGSVEKYVPLDWGAKAPSLFPTLGKINTRFFLGLADNLRKSVVGGRVTQTEIGWIKQAVLPQQGEDPDDYDTRVQIAKEEIARKMNNPEYIIGSGVNNKPTPNPSGTSGSSGSNDPLGIRK